MSHQRRTTRNTFNKECFYPDSRGIGGFFVLRRVRQISPALKCRGYPREGSRKNEEIIHFSIPPGFLAGSVGLDRRAPLYNYYIRVLHFFENPLEFLEITSCSGDSTSVISACQKSRIPKPCWATRHIAWTNSSPCSFFALCMPL